MDIQIMIFVGFGFLMTFLPRFGYSAVCFTMIITVVCVELTILLSGFININPETMEIPITWLRYAIFCFIISVLVLFINIILVSSKFKLIITQF